MWALLSQLVAVCVLAALTVDAMAPYCYHPNNNCVPPSRCNDSTQFCPCPVGFLGSDCALPQNYILDESQCNFGSGCSRQGYCIQDVNFMPTCYCNFGHMGPACQFRNFTATCNFDSMTIELMTPGTKAVFINEHEKCHFKDITTGKDKSAYLTRYTSTLPYSGKCGFFNRKTIAHNRMEYSTTINVRERIGGYWSTADYSKNFSCQYVASRRSEIRPSIEDNQVFEVRLEYQNNIVDPSAAQVSQSEPFRLIFFPTASKLKENPQYTIGIHSLKMINADTSQEIYDVVIDDCPTDVATRGVLADRIRVESFSDPNSSASVKATIVSFAAIHKALRIAFDYSIKLCDGPCEKVSCKGKRLPTTFRGLRLKVEV